MSAGNDLGRALKALSVLLGYPDEALREHSGELARTLAGSAELTAADRAAVRGFVGSMVRQPLLDLQARYVDTFDRSKKVSLYLFEHIYGESRDRGQAMAELAQVYREHGLAIDCRELPDFLPLFLEFAAELPEAEARAWLDEIGHIVQRVHVRLRERESPYAVPLRMLLRLARIDAEPPELARMAAQETRDDTPAAIDRAWAEAPVTFGPEGLAPDAGLGTCGSGANEAMGRRR